MRQIDMKAYVGVELLVHAFVIPAIGGSEWSASRLDIFPPPG
jgi:hypothetical protein